MYSNLADQTFSPCPHLSTSNDLGACIFTASLDQHNIKEYSSTHLRLAAYWNTTVVVFGSEVRYMLQEYVRNNVSPETECLLDGMSQSNLLSCTCREASSLSS